LITHCNFDNGFAEGNDHSLNLTRAQAELFKTVIIGHEHLTSVRGNVTAVGSMAPCCPAEAEMKYMWHLSAAGDLHKRSSLGTELLGVVDWQGLNSETLLDGGFIKVTGQATADEANVVLKEIDAFRKRSKAYMIQNAVKVGKIDLGALEQETHADLDKFDAMAELLGMLGEGDLERLRKEGLI
jgi:hypothetical protein